jgi:hypothetical protein
MLITSAAVMPAAAIAGERGGHERDRAPGADHAVVDAPVAGDLAGEQHVRKRHERGMDDAADADEQRQREKTVGPMHGQIGRAEDAVRHHQDHRRGHVAVSEPGDERARHDAHQRRDGEQGADGRGAELAAGQEDREERHVDADAEMRRERHGEQAGGVDTERHRCAGGGAAGG